MTSNEILKADLLDILFDNRNKQYGAYTLRKNYNHRLAISLGISLLSILFFLFLIGNKNGSNGASSKPDSYVELTKLVPPDIKKQEQIIPDKPKPVQQVRQQQFTKFEIKPDDKVDKPVADQNTLLNSLISTHTLDGRTPTFGDVPTIKDPPPTGNGNGDQKINTIIPEEREPEFPGGQEAWLNFLRRNLSAPDELEAGEKKSVTLRFIVSVDGAVTGLEVIQSAGRSFDNEVIRVLKKMPKWKPAIQNGVPVVKYYTQPVTFIGLEQ